MNEGAASSAARLKPIGRSGSITAISAAEQRHAIVVVLGMHRSGTSLCSHVLSALGVDMADEVTAQPSNAKGHWERWEIVERHDRVLALFNRGFYTPAHDFGLPPGWWADPRVAEIRREITEFLETRMGGGLFGFKDPRTARLMPMWHQVFEELKLAPRIVYCLRDPAQVGRSLAVRDGFERELGEYRWLGYTADFFRYARAYETCVVEYETWFGDALFNAAKLRSFLGLPWQQSEADLKRTITGIVDRELRHDEARADAITHPMVQALYDIAKRVDSDPAAHEQGQQIAEQFVRFDELQGAFHRAFERNQELAARVPTLEAELEELRRRIAVLHDQADTAAQALTQREAGELDQAARIAELEGAYQEALATAEWLIAETATLRGNLADAERQAADAERQAAEAGAGLRRATLMLDTARSENQQLRGVVARGERNAQASAAAHNTRLLESQSRLEEVKARADESDRRADHAERLVEQLRGDSARLDEQVQKLAGVESRLRRALTEMRERLADREHAAVEREAIFAARLADHGRRLAEAERRAAQSEQALRSESKRLATALAEARSRSVSVGGAWARLRDVSPIRRWRVAAAVEAGSRAGKARDWAAAARRYRDALIRDPGLMPVWVQLGHALKEQGDLAGAEGAYLRALALDGSIADTHLQLAHLLKLQNRWSEAVDAYETAQHLAPDLGDAKTELESLSPQLIAEADKARDAQDWPDAAKLYRAALDRAPELPPIWVQLGHALKEGGDYDGAEAAYRRALDLDSTVADTYLQLGHLMNLQARRTQAIEAYATAVRLDPDLLPARESLHALVGYSPTETERALLASQSDPKPAPEVAPASAGDAALEWADPTIRVGPVDGLLSSTERYGPLYPEAVRRQSSGADIIWFGVIDWHFRIQRPQHLARCLAEQGARVFYVSIVFESADAKGRYRIIESPHPGVFEIRLRLRTDPSERIYQGLSEAAVAELQLALDELIETIGLRAPTVLVEHPAWHRVALGVPGGTVVYDCLDLAAGFSNVPEALPDWEDALVADADLVVAASRPLAELVERKRPCAIVRNAAEFDVFAQAFSDRPVGGNPVIGYFGAIADWFNIEWIEACAVAHPNWEFRLIGRTHGCDIARASRLPNIRFLNERPYEDLPKLLSEFDVATIPFKMLDLTRCTNPVKLYEYMSAGKPVVAAPMPEVVEATDLAYIATDAASFGDCIARALAENSPELRRRRQAWAREHTWASRARELNGAMESTLPLVSIVVLTYNNWSFSRDCLQSVRAWSDYPNLEIIVVDNGSGDATPEQLAQLQRLDHRFRVILNDENLGFPAGNNIGLRAARGEYVILLNNDTVVTHGWVRDLIRPLQRDPAIGLVGPLTNNIGNEQKIQLRYRSMAEMAQQARRFVRGRLRRTYHVETLAFFCVAMRRSLLDEVGLLDEAFGLGFFEDDDYCRRVAAKGYKLVIADDVFVHHHLSVSWQTLGRKAGEQMARNREIFERRWGPWQPHRYRDEPGFG